MDRADMDRVTADFVRAARAAPPRPASIGSSCTARTATCCRASSRRSPTGAAMTYGGSLANRLRYPLEVFAARARGVARNGCRCRCASRRTIGSKAASRPTMRCEIARAFKAAGADLIDCSSGQVSARPEAGLRPHVPDAVRRPHPQRSRASPPSRWVRSPRPTTSTASSPPAAPTSCAIARPHLANPAWTLAEAAKIGFAAIDWPRQYRTAKPQMEANFQRERATALGMHQERHDEPHHAALRVVRICWTTTRSVSRRAAEHGDHLSLKLWLRLLAVQHAESRPKCGNGCARVSGSRWRASTILRSCIGMPMGLSMSTLSRYLMVTGGNVTALTDELEREGMVQRDSDPEDRRSWRLRMTAAGRKAFERIAREHEQWVIETVRRPRRRAKAVVVRGLGRLRVQMAATRDKRREPPTAQGEFRSA